MEKEEAGDFRDLDLPKDHVPGSLHQLEGIVEVLEQYRTTMGPSREEILFIEGNEHYRDLIHRVLVYKGYDVETMTDDQQAYAYCLDCRPRMVLIDLDLPRKAGWQLLKKIQQKCDPMPVIALTSRDDATIHQEACSAGFVDVVTKPFVPAQLMSTIRKHWKNTKKQT